MCGGVIFPYKKEYKQALEHLLTAMRIRRTRAGCEESIQAAIKACPKAKRAYIEKEWFATCPQWAIFARQHSSLLIQVCSSNIIMYLSY